MVLFGYNVSLEDAAANVCLRIFKSSAYYALTEEEISEIMEADKLLSRCNDSSNLWILCLWNLALELNS
jgi:hypothetical protein